MQRLAQAWNNRKIIKKAAIRATRIFLVMEWICGKFIYLVV
jgi:hypothetical protein